MVFDSGAGCIKRFPQLVALLQIQPKISSIPKYGRQHQ